MRHFAKLCVILLAIQYAVPAESNELTNHGLTPRSTAMADAVTADVKDASALYYNPAGLADAINAASLDFAFAINILSIKLMDREPRFDISERAYDGTPTTIQADDFFPPTATGQHPNGRSDTKNTDISTSLVVGLTLDSGLDWLKGALLVFLPLQKTDASTYYPDSREQYFSNQLKFSVLGQQAPSPILMMGAGVKPLRWLKFGATLVMYRRNTTTYNAMLSDPAIPDSYKIMNQIDKESKLAPGFNLGLEIDPVEKFGIAISYRHKTYTGETLVSSVDANNFTSENPNPGAARYNADIHFINDFNPSDLTLGFRFGNHCPWVFNVDTTWRMWRKYDALGDGTAKNQFHDVVIPKLGFEYEINGRLDLRAGASYIVNPVYNQDSDTNFVDNDRVRLAIGLGIALPWHPEARLSFHAQLLILVPRTFEKIESNMTDEFPESVDLNTGELIGDNDLQTNNPGFPGYESRGIVPSLGMGLNIPF